MAAPKTKDDVEVKGLVPVLIPLSEDVNAPNFTFVACNGKTYKIKRGEQVMVPPEIKEIIDNSNAAKAELRARIRESR